MQHAVEKTFLVSQPVQPVALTSKVACYQSRIVSGGLNRQKPAEIARRDPPPGGEVGSALIGTHRYQWQAEWGVFQVNEALRHCKR